MTNNFMVGGEALYWCTVCLLQVYVERGDTSDPRTHQDFATTPSSANPIPNANST